MSIYKQANELSMALSSLLKKMCDSMGEVEGVPVEDRNEYAQFQSLLTTSVFLQRDLDEFLERAMTFGEQAGRPGGGPGFHQRVGPFRVALFSRIFSLRTRQPLL